MKLNFKTIFILLLFFSACQKNEKAKPIIIDFGNEKKPDQICYNLDISFIDSSNTKAILHANRAQIYLDSNQTLLDNGVNVRFYNTNEKQTGILNAEKIRIDDLTKNMFASEKVVVISDSSQTKLETSELEWNNEKKKIYSKVYVKITSPNEIIEGFGLESDENLTNYKIFKVKGIRYNN